MSEKEPRGGDRVEAIKVPCGEQTIPIGSKGNYLGEMPQIPGLHGIEWDEEITVGKGKSKLVVVFRNEFKVLEGEEKK